MTTTNDYQTAARVRKASAIADLLHAKGTDADIAAKLDQAGRDAAAAIVGVNSPSEETWKLVVFVLRERARLATTDPFVGLS